MTDIGFIGLGIMGSRMAHNLLAAGHTLTVHNRTASKAQPLLDAGAAWAETPAQAAAEVVFSMLAHPEAIRAVALGEDGLLSAMQPGTLWVDCSTVNPMAARELGAAAAERGVRFIDAPVAGSKKQAADGVLVFFAGGESADLEAAQPLLDVMGSRVLHIGEVGMGNAIKMVVNHMLAASITAFAEGAALGLALGIPQETLFNTLIGGPVAAPFLAGKRAKMENAAYDPEFPLKWMRKDLHMVAESAYQAGVAMPLSKAAGEIFQMAIDAGHGEDDFSALYRYVTGE